jgi:hypothetical protein
MREVQLPTRQSFWPIEADASRLLVEPMGLTPEASHTLRRADLDDVSTLEAVSPDQLVGLQSCSSALCSLI